MVQQSKAVKDHKFRYKSIMIIFTHRARIAISRSVCFNRRPPTTARDVDTRNWKTMRIELQDRIHYIEPEGEFIEQRIIW